MNNSAARAEIRREDLGSPTAAMLIGALNAELSARYPEEGATHFRLDPDEVVDGRRAFFIAYLGADPVGCGAFRRPSRSCPRTRAATSRRERLASREEDTSEAADGRHRNRCRPWAFQEEAARQPQRVVAVNGETPSRRTQSAVSPGGMVTFVGRSHL